MAKIDPLTQIARLQTKMDFLETELTFLNTTLKRCGFSRGIETLKETMQQILLETPPINPKKNLH